jgi:DNA-binding MarR family transcriptional regulator
MKEQWPLTPTQRRFLDAVDRMTREKRGIGPSYDELSLELNCSQTAITDLVKRLCAKGWLQKIPKTPRSLRVLRSTSAQKASS